jgi:hypothetical protein
MTLRPRNTARRAAVGRTMRLLIPLLLLLYLAAPAARAQARLEARVVDADTGVPLPGATITVRGTRTGGVATSDGRVTLALPRLPASIEIRLLGYEAEVYELARADVGVDGVVARVFRLTAAPVPLDELTVTDENPAVSLWRRVLARRPGRLARLGRYTARAYTRLLLTRQTDIEENPVRLAEHLSAIVWEHGSGAREEAVARRRVPAGGPFRFADAEAIPDPYFENVVTLDGQRFLSPAHPDALRYYTFSEGPAYDSLGRRFVDITLQPLRAQPGFLVGRIRVVLPELMIAEMDVRPITTPPPGVRDFEAAYRVQYAPVLDSLWLPERFERTGRVIAGGPLSSIPTVLFRQVSHVWARFPGRDAPGEAGRAGDRYYAPGGLPGTRDLFLPHRNALPLTAEEAAAERTLGPTPLNRLLVQRGMGFALPIVGQLNRIDVEGSDD